MIFAQANLDNFLIIKNVLDKYCRMSSQLVNYHKSTFQCTKNMVDSACFDF